MLIDGEHARRTLAAIRLFNDVIAREAFSHGLTLIDLRLVCSEDTDFANPIEPSVAGGAKIAAAIAGFAANLRDRSPRSTVHGSGTG